jgi:hypothetical protein
MKIIAFRSGEDYNPNMTIQWIRQLTMLIHHENKNNFFEKG